MPTREQRAREIQGSIRRILAEQWDPIGGCDGSIPRDEYDDYIGGVYRLLASGASPEAVARHLASIERGAMGLPADSHERLDVARILCALDVHLGETDDAR